MQLVMKSVKIYTAVLDQPKGLLLRNMRMRIRYYFITLLKQTFMGGPTTLSFVTMMRCSHTETAAVCSGITHNCQVLGRLSILPLPGSG